MTWDYASFRRFVATICVAAACLFCVQATLIHLDRIEHALELDHKADPLAGTLVAAASPACEATAASCDQQNDFHLATHAHQGDTASSMLSVPLPAVTSTEAVSLIIRPFVGHSGNGTWVLAPERPPKA